MTNAAPAGTTFCLASGTFEVPSDVTLRDGDKLIGAGIEATHILGTGAQNILNGVSGANRRSHRV